MYSFFSVSGELLRAYFTKKAGISQGKVENRAAFGCLFLLRLLTSGTVSEVMQAGRKRAGKARPPEADRLLTVPSRNLETM